MTGLRQEDLSMHSIYMSTLDLYSLKYLWQGLDISYAIWRVHPTRSNTIYLHECYDHSKLALYESQHAIHAPMLNAVSTMHLLVNEHNSYDVINHSLYLSIDNTYEHMVADEWKRVINDMYDTDAIMTWLSTPVAGAVAPIVRRRRWRRPSIPARRRIHKRSGPISTSQLEWRLRHYWATAVAHADRYIVHADLVSIGSTFTGAVAVLIEADFKVLDDVPIACDETPVAFSCPPDFVDSTAASSAYVLFIPTPARWIHFQRNKNVTKKRAGLEMSMFLFLV